MPDPIVGGAAMFGIGVLQEFTDWLLARRDKQREIASLVFGLIYGGSIWAYVVVSGTYPYDRWTFAHEHIYDILSAAALVGTVAFVGALRESQRRNSGGGNSPSWARALLLGCFMGLVGLITAFSTSMPFNSQFVTYVAVPTAIGIIVTRFRVADIIAPQGQPSAQQKGRGRKTAHEDTIK